MSVSTTALRGLRPLMFSIAYRMLGSVTEAEDVTQEAMLRVHQGIDGEAVLRNPDAYATTVTTRLALDALRAARRRREHYVGSWLPEPLLGDDPDPAHQFDQDETVSMAFLVLLERLSPSERAVFLLRDVFGYAFADIAAILRRSEQACRQHGSRARRRIDAGRPRFEPSATRRDQLALAFFDAVRRGDLATLESLLAEDVRFEADGGGRAPAIRKPLVGSTAVARFILGLQRQGSRLGVELQEVTANGQPAGRYRGPDGAVLAVLALDIVDGRVAVARNQINPEKLDHLGPVGDLYAMLGSADRQQ